MSKVVIHPHGIELDLDRGVSNIDHNAVETFVDETVEIRSSGEDPITASAKGDDEPTEGSSLSLVSGAEPCTVTLKFRSGKRRELRLVTVAESALKRVQVPKGKASTRATFIRAARPVLRSALRHGRINDAGELDADALPTHFGSDPQGALLPSN